MDKEIKVMNEDELKRFNRIKANVSTAIPITEAELSWLLKKVEYYKNLESALTTLVRTYT